jgi:hypothetical protein
MSAKANLGVRSLNAQGRKRGDFAFPGAPD